MWGPLIDYSSGIIEKMSSHIGWGISDAGE